MFDAEVFVNQCQAARTTADPMNALRMTVGAAITEGPSIDATLGAVLKEADVLFSSADLTVQRILWPGGLFTSAHEHRMWAVIGVYRGEELNHFYKRTPDGVKECGERAAARGEILLLDADVIHAVQNPHREMTAALHVYGGDILGIERSAWGPDGREVSFGDDASLFRSMMEPMRDLAKEHDRHLDDDARYDAIVALRSACESERRYPTPAEARRIIADAWQIPA